jgi:hypothetical protein
MAQRADVKLSSLIGTVESTTSATVGVDKTFSPEGFIAPGVSRWVDRSGGISIGFPFFTMSVRAPTKASRVYRVTIKLGLPVLETVTASTATGVVPAAMVAYTNQCIMEFLLPDRSTLAERQSLLSYVRSLFATTIQASDAVPTDSTGSPVIGAVANYDPPY